MAEQHRSGSKFDVIKNPVYQVDWQCSSSGKKVAATKRRVRWRFGFSNADAIARGQSGTNCRGEEHEIVLVWSLTSGKRLVVADGREAHFSQGRRTDSRFETSWTMTGGHVLKIVAHVAPPLFPTPGFRQFDLTIDGLSFYDMPKIFELGTRAQNKAVTASSRAITVDTTPSAYNNYALDDDHSPFTPPAGHFDDYGRVENRHFAEPSYERHYKYEERPLSTRSAPTPRRSTAEVAPKKRVDPPPRREEPEPRATAATDLLSEPTHTNDLLTPASAPSQGNGFSQPAAPTDEFAPVETVPEPPSFQVVANSIMSAYAPAAPPATNNGVLALANEPHTYHTPQQEPAYQQPAAVPVSPDYGSAYQQQPAYSTPVYGQPPAPPGPVYAQPAAPVYENPAAPQQPAYEQTVVVETAPEATEVQHCEPAPITPTMEPLSIEEMERREQPPMSEMDNALKNLVNLGDLTESLETPEQAKDKQKKIATQPARSKPVPPTAAAWHLGQNARLGEIKENAPARAAPAKEIMRTHAFDPAAAQAGMLVVYGATASIPQANGFGAGVHPSHHQSYAQQPMYAGVGRY